MHSPLEALDFTHNRLSQHALPGSQSSFYLIIAGLLVTPPLQRRSIQSGFPFTQPLTITARLAGKRHLRRQQNVL